MKVPGAASSLPCFEFAEFDGPIDLLVDEVRRQNVAIEKVAMAPIVSRFLEYTRSAAERSLNLDIEWLHMAATLIHWKSRSLLPSDAAGQPESDPIRDHLVQLLLAHRAQAAADLAGRKALEEARFSRAGGAELRERNPGEAVEPEAQDLSVWQLIRQAHELSAWVEERRRKQSELAETLGIAADDVTVTDMVEYLRTELTVSGGKLDGTRLMGEQPTASRRACLFLGMLQMAAGQEVQLEQNVSFGAIRISSVMVP